MVVNTIFKHYSHAASTCKYSGIHTFILCIEVHMQRLFFNIQYLPSHKYIFPCVYIYTQYSICDFDIYI